MDCLCRANITLFITCSVDCAADGTKQPCTLEKTKEEEQEELIAREKEGENKGDAGPSVELKEEESKDGAEVKPSKEKLTATETAAGSKPPGDKYSPKVSPENPLCLLYCSM